MSRVGNRIIIIPENVQVEIKQTLVKVFGPLGELQYQFRPEIAIAKQGQEITTLRANDIKQTKQLHGTTNSLIQNMIIGVTKGFKKTLIINGVGYKAKIKDEQLILNLGYSNPRILKIPIQIKVEVIKQTKVIVSGIDKVKVGQFAAVIRVTRKTNPYTGKGVKYDDEKVIRKEGKVASGAGAK